MTATIGILRGEGDGQQFAAGQTIFAEGDPGDVMYGVTEGEVEIRVGDRAVETLGPGGIFGEMALIDASPRSATAVAKSACTLVPMDSKRFERLVSYNPFFALQVMRILAGRLRRQNNGQG
jgi:CRP/FNR family transcriptional regulator, cyclic AMP receptor protein